jgi:hypothetical protein
MIVKEKWLMPNGKTATVEWNPCRCHPRDVLVIWGRGMKNCGSYINQNKSTFTKWLKGRGWTRTERVIVK